jgi:hypothetical protein
MSRLIVNLSFLSSQPTGLSVYAKNLLPHLRPLDPTTIQSQPISNSKYHQLNVDFTRHRGNRGHLRRLLWGQFQLPKIYDRLQSMTSFPSDFPSDPLLSINTSNGTCHRY